MVSLWVGLFVFATLAFDATVILYSALSCTFVSVVLLQLCCRLNRSPVSASHPAAIHDCSLWESPCSAPHSCDRASSRCLCRSPCHAFVALILSLRCCRHAEYSRQSTCVGPALLQLMPSLLSTAFGVGHLFTYSGSVVMPSWFIYRQITRAYSGSAELAIDAFCYQFLSTDHLFWPSHFFGRCLLLSVRLVAIAFIYVVVKLPTLALISRIPVHAYCWQLFQR
jgi:hypothetical protein